MSVRTQDLHVRPGGCSRHPQSSRAAFMVGTVSGLMPFSMTRELAYNQGKQILEARCLLHPAPYGFISLILHRYKIKEMVSDNVVYVKHIHHIIISDHADLQYNLSCTLSENISSLRKCYPHAQSHLWTKDTLRDFIKDNFPSRVLSAYDRLAANTAKADLGRYCLLSVYGGIYSDLSNYFFAPLPISEQHTIACFRDVEPYAGASWAVTPTILYATVGQEEIQLAIDLLVANVEARHYGNNPLCPTGPVLFGRALAVANRPENYWIGQMMAMSGTYPNRNHVFMGLDKQSIALRMQAEGGKVALIGIHGGNDYNHLWKKRIYFSERPSLLRKFVRKYKISSVPELSNIIKKECRYKKRKNIFSSHYGSREYIYRIPINEKNEGNKNEKNWEDICKIYPNLDPFIINEENSRRFLHKKFGKEIMKIYTRLECCQIKTDLVRWGMLLLQGGLYINADHQILNPFDLPRQRALGFFRSALPEKGVAWSVNDTLIRARPEQPEIRLAFGLTVAICRRKLSGQSLQYYGASSIFGRAVALSYRQKRYWCGETVEFPNITSGQGPRYGLITPRGTMIAISG
ncbi:glycosyltransferase [Komagataeibacter europaeus]|uniref:glycosyltransferase n=1 Tax=Komagataeibacter europaeus TaxID=33995 RepID=UPI001650FB0E|nr:glycosyltransferase [Komagataeibacter europaeus]